MDKKQTVENENVEKLLRKILLLEREKKQLEGYFNNTEDETERTEIYREFAVLNGKIKKATLEIMAWYQVDKYLEDRTIESFESLMEMPKMGDVLKVLQNLYRVNECYERFQEDLQQKREKIEKKDEVEK
ncbi:MAG: hypothetical protein AB7U45_03825 [Desulfamplus sp.]